VDGPLSGADPAPPARIRRRQATCALAVLATTVTANLILASVCPASAIPDAESVAILPTAPWTPSGLLVTAGRSLAITADGSIRFVDGQHYAATPSGRSPCLRARKSPFFTDASAPCYSLLGRIGADGVPFEVGTSFATVSASSSGELYLGPNDNRFPDNRGTWVAHVLGATPLSTTNLGLPTPSAPVAPVTPAALHTSTPSPSGAPAPGTSGATVPSGARASATRAPSGPLAFTGLGPAEELLALLGLVFVVVGLTVLSLGRRLRRLALWLIGL